jgi:thiol-disulfide isomerase/thioredoxin
MGTFSGLISLFCIVSFSMVNIGNKLPSFVDETQWLKGKAPKFENEITIIELWSSSCGSCREEIKHLTSLQKSYGDRISIIGLTIDPIDVLKKFINEHNNEIGYTVGRVSKDVMSVYLEGVSLIPYCFILDKERNVIWRGHPAKIEENLDKILAGTIDVERLKKIDELGKTLNDETTSNDLTSAGKVARSILDIDPTNIQSLQVVINYAKHNKVQGLIREIFDHIQMIDLNAYKANQISIMLLSDTDLAYRYPDAAMKFATYALKQEPENGGYINTYARFLYCISDVEKAIEWQKKAVKIVPDNESYHDNLNYYLSIKTLRDNNNDNNLSRSPGSKESEK